MRLAQAASICLLLSFAALSAFGQSNPVPFVNQPLVPSAVAPGGPDFTLTVNGTGFVSGATVNWNGMPLTTTFVSSSQLTATVPAANIATAGTASVTVNNPGAGRSNPAFFTVTFAVPGVVFDAVPFDLPNSTTSPWAAVGDFNGDGNLDVALAEENLDAVGILLGNGDGTFQFSGSYSMASDPVALVNGDFNGDGLPDLAACDGSGNVSIFLGKGNGTLQALATYYLGLASGITCGLATGDFNGDGKLDIIAASASLEILLGNVDGTFQPPQIIGGGYSVAVGDYNGGGKLDVAAAGSLIAGSSQLAILLGNGNGTFQPPKTYAPPPNTYSSSVATADFNGDGKLDLAVGYYSVPPSHTLEGSLSVMLGNGDGTFQNPSTYTASGPVTGVLPMDLNGDGLLDLALTNGQDSNLLSVL